MITKLTAENAELYYAPRFAEITAALKAAGKDIEIRSLEDYFLYLTDIAELTIGAKEMPNAYLLVLPADEEIFAIDANTRAISVPAFVKKNGVGVYGDHRAEMIVLTVDRYFDHEDFLNDQIVINWNFTPSGARVPMYEENQAARAFAPNEELNPGKITFGFIITKDMTPQKGTLTFSVTIYDERSNEIVYSFNTLTASVAINDTLTLKDPSIVENDTDNYVGRLVNSVYTDNTIAPIGNPEWRSGELINGQYSGLDAVAYFKSYEDLRDLYTEGALLTAYAGMDPATADIVYKWTFSPVDGTVETVRDFVTENKAADYIEVELPEADNGAIFYQADGVGRPITTEPLTWAQAKAIADSVDESETRPFMNLTVKKIVESEVPNDGNVEDCTFNQTHLALAVSGNHVHMSSTETLRSFASTNEAQGSGQWVGLDINTGLDSIIGLSWNGYVLTEDDVAEAASVNLPAGHIIFWVKADVVAITAANVTITSDNFRPTSFSVDYTQVNKNYLGGRYPLVITNTVEVPTFLVRGTSFRALSAGNYQVVAQARVSAGEKYEQVLPNAELKVGTEYYVKVNDEIDKLNPLVNNDAIAAQERGEELYVLVSAARNSVPVESSVLSVPPAKKPVTQLSVESVYEFTGDVAKDPDYQGEEYIYIDDTQIPVIVATVTIDSEDQRDSAGAFVAELVQTSEALPTFDEIEQKVADHDLEFVALPSDGKFTFEPEEIQEGEYVARTINRRNGTYSISDNSESIHTSFVAPEINKIDVSAVFEDENDIPALVNGFRPQSGIVNFELNRNRPSYDFVLVDNSENFEEAECTYFIEEVEYDEQTGVVRERTEEDRAADLFDAEEDLRRIEVVQDENENNVYKFSITQDPGYYRIKTMNRYHGTIHTSYTDVFGVVTH